MLGWEYVLFRIDRSSTVERRGSGVLLYVREELSPVEFHPSTEYPEQVWCRLGDVGERGFTVGGTLLYCITGFWL